MGWGLVMDRPAFLGLPDGPIYTDEELQIAFDGLEKITVDERLEFMAYMRDRKEARAEREKARDETPRVFGGVIV